MPVFVSHEDGLSFFVVTLEVMEMRRVLSSPPRRKKGRALP
jgi:hypothetical protein